MKNRFLPGLFAIGLLFFIMLFFNSSALASSPSFSHVKSTHLLLVGDTLAFQVIATDSDINDILTITKEGPGELVTVPHTSPDTGFYSWAPGLADTIGDYYVVFYVNDGTGKADTAKTLITVVIPDTIEIDCLEHVDANAKVTVDVRLWTDETVCGLTIPLTFYNPLNTDIVCDSVQFSSTFWSNAPFMYGGDVYNSEHRIVMYAAWYMNFWPTGNNLWATLHFTTGAAWDTSIGVKIDSAFYPPSNVAEIDPCETGKPTTIEFLAGCLDTNGINNLPPEISVPLDLDTSLSFGSTLCLKYIIATDLDASDTLILEKVSGPGTFIPDTGLSPLSDSICFEPTIDSTYEFVFRVTDPWGKTDQDTFFVTFTTTDVPETSSTGIPGFVLEQNYPNPFNLKTSMSFKIPYGCRVSLKIYNLAGQLVNTLVDGKMEKGQHTIFWDGSNSAGDPVASGIYFYKLTASDFVSVKKMILLK